MQLQKQDDWSGAPTFNLAIYGMLAEEPPGTIYVSPGEHLLSMVVRGHGLIQIAGHFHLMSEDELREFADRVKSDFYE